MPFYQYRSFNIFHWPDREVTDWHMINKDGAFIFRIFPWILSRPNKFNHVRIEYSYYACRLLPLHKQS